MTVTIPVRNAKLEGELSIPEGAGELIVFVHGSGSSRFSERNNFVADRLRSAGFGTLLFDLLTAEEDRTYANRFDIPLITDRLLEVTVWLGMQRETARLSYGYFGASTGSAAALRACAYWAGKADAPEVRAAVSRGGRPDMVGADLATVAVPTLLIVGGDDTTVLKLNRDAYAQLQCERELRVVDRAGHLFEEPGALEQVAELSAAWFLAHAG